MLEDFQWDFSEVIKILSVLEGVFGIYRILMTKRNFIDLYEATISWTELYNQDMWSSYLVIMLLV